MLENSKFPPRVYLLAIQTMCCVSFLKLDDHGLPEFRVLPKKELKTKDCAYPLVILLRNLIEAINESERGLLDCILRFFGLKEDLTDYLDELDSNVDEPALYEEL